MIRQVAAESLHRPPRLRPTPHTAPVRLFGGLGIRCELPLPELALGTNTEARFQIRLGKQRLIPGSARSPKHAWRDATGQLTLSLHHYLGKSHLRIPGLAQARFDTSTQLTVWPQPGIGMADLRHALLDQLLPRLLAADGALMLHAAAVVPGPEGAVLLLGESGLGKSTLCAAWTRAGARLLSDDCLRMDCSTDDIRVTPTYAGMRLLPDSLKALYGPDTPSSSPVAAYTQKRRLAIDPLGTEASTHTRVAAIAVLQPPDSAPGVTLQRLSDAEATVALLDNSFTLDPTDMRHNRRLLTQAAQIAQQVPIHAVHYRRDYERLPEVISNLESLA